ncbi:DUF1249 domain-containing protein [Marinobacteraceae bacterium S3BR75-40.1]
MRRRAYVADLTRLGALSEGNYHRMSRLLKLAAGSDTLRIDLHNGRQYLGRVQFRLLQRARYTDTWYLEQLHNQGRWLNNPRMTVRSYHDANLTEVISCYRHRRIEPVSDYPNRFMHHPDEKIQINAFLADWLGFCLRFGHVDDLEPVWER